MVSQANKKKMKPENENILKTEMKWMALRWLISYVVVKRMTFEIEGLCFILLSKLHMQFYSNHSGPYPCAMYANCMLCEHEQK